MDENIKPVKYINAIQCNHCGEVIESKYRHDFKWCGCGSVAVDGGGDYRKRCGNPGDWTEVGTSENELLQN